MGREALVPGSHTYAGLWLCLMCWRAALAWLQERRTQWRRGEPTEPLPDLGAYAKPHL